MNAILEAMSSGLSAATAPWALAAAGAKFVVYASSLLAAGFLLFRLSVPRTVPAGLFSRNWLILCALAVAALATIMRVLIQAGRLMDDGIAGMLDPEIIAISLEGPLGQSTYLRLSGLAICALALLPKPVSVPATIVGATMVAASFALTGHATRDPQLLLAALLTVHLLAIGFWWGAIVPLHRLAGRDSDLDRAADASERFGKQASIIVPALIVAGGIFAWLLLGDVTTLLTTKYGWLLIGKLSLVAIVLSFAALNKLRFVPALQTGGSGAAARFRRSLRWEAVAFLLVFAATAVLTTSFTVPTS